MADMQGIVQALNAPPFSMGLTLVAFDEKTPTELLQILTQVLGELDGVHKVDLRDEPRDITAQRMIDFLRVLKYPLVPGDVQAFGAMLQRGDTNAVYPVLSFVLSRLIPLKKRAYVARYLLPLEVPPDVATDEGVGALLDEYTALQGEFKETHKALDKMSTGQGAKAAPVELQREIRQLEDERRQLLDRIAALKKKTSDVQGFAQLLAATSAQRKEQEEEARLIERMAEQRAALQAAERRYADANRRLAETRASTREDVSGEDVLLAVRREHADHLQLTEKVLPASLHARHETLSRLQRALSLPSKSEAELYSLRAEADALEKAVTTLTRDLTAAQRAAGDDKLAMYRQQAALVARALAGKEEGLESLVREGEALTREAEAKEAKLSQLSGPRFMKKEEFKAYAAGLRAKTAQFKALRAELNDLRGESVTVARTEGLLKSRAGDMDAFLRRQEEKKGVAGYTAVASDLEKVSSLKARIDESKGATLSEISRIVDDINKAIGERKGRLAPAIAQLRAVRGEFSELESRHLKERAAYDSIAAGIEADKAALEKAADLAQSEAVAEEGRVVLLQALTEQAASLLDRARQEASYEAGEGRYARDFPTLKGLYTSKLAALEGLAKELRKKQKELKENAGENSVQRGKFVELQKLLDAKLTSYASGAGRVGAEYEGTGIMSWEGQDEGRAAYGAVAGAHEGSGRAVEFASGGAHVMKIGR